MERERKYRELRNKSLAYRQQVQEWYDVVALSTTAAAGTSSHITGNSSTNDDTNDTTNDDSGEGEGGLSSASTVVVENTTTTSTNSSSRNTSLRKKRRVMEHNRGRTTNTNIVASHPAIDAGLINKQEGDFVSTASNNSTCTADVISSSSNSRIHRATKSLAALKARCSTNNNNNNNNKTNYKYQEVVRKKEDRRQLKAYDCADCRAFLDAICKDKNGKNHGMFDRGEFVQECSRHRARHVPEETPPGFWELSFADSVAARGDGDGDDETTSSC